jgi:hypothetical protein
MRTVLALLTMLVFSQAMADEGLILPTVEFSATAVQDAGRSQTKETIHYADGKLRIDRANGFSSTILDFTTQSQCLLMANHTYLVLPMDNDVFHRYIARSVEVTGARKLGPQWIDGLSTTKYAFGDDGALNAAGSYLLTNTGIMVRREYEDGLFGQSLHHLEYLTDLTVTKQPADLFVIPPGYMVAK